MPETPEDFDEKSESSSPLDKAGDFVKYLTALATGALVFSAELLKKDYALPEAARRLVLVSWICLALSALCGLAAMARIPMMLSEQSHDLEDAFLKWPLRGQQGFLSFGIVTLGIAMALSLWSAPTSSLAEQTPIPSETNISHQKYAIVSSAPHMLGKSPMHQHTFLLDQDSGGVWEMSCDAKNKVRFRVTDVENLPRK